MQCILALAFGFVSFYGQIIRKVHGQVPVIVLLSQEKGLGKTSCMKAVLWATSRVANSYNNSTSPEFILSKAATTTLLIGLDDTSSAAKEEKIFVAVFDKGPSINDVTQILGLFRPPPPLVTHFGPIIRVNPRNLPYYVTFWATPLPPSRA